jgi:hypothetical protein
MKSKRSIPHLQRPLVHLPFDEALQITPLLDDLQKAAQSSLVSELAQFPGDIGSAALQAASLGMNWGTRAAEFTKETESLLRSGKLVLTESKDGMKTFLSAKNGGGFVENAKLAKGAGAAAKLANVVAIAVNICHVVSGIDTARKVERISKDVQFLREARRVTQLSRLEAIYRHAKELLSGPVGDHERHRLHDLTMSLFELRAEWRRELMLNLDNVKNDEAGWWGLTSKQHRQRGLDEEKKKVISRGEVEIQLMDFSIVLQMALSFAAGRHEPFLFVSMPDELRDWERIGELLHAKAGYIKDSSAKQGVTVAPLLNHFDSIVQRFQAITEYTTDVPTLDDGRFPKKRKAPSTKKVTSRKNGSSPLKPASKTKKKPRLVKSKRAQLK